MVLSEAVTSALGRARRRTHLHTHTLTRRGCTYTALLCNDDYFCPLSLSSTHIPTPMHLSPPPGMAVSWLRLRTRPRPSDRFIHRLELLHWRSCLTQTREKERMARGGRRRKSQGSPANAMMEVNSFGAQRFGDGWLAMAEVLARVPGDGS
jgi:hypothetical protein